MKMDNNTRLSKFSLEGVQGHLGTIVDELKVNLSSTLERYRISKENKLVFEREIEESRELMMEQ